MLTRLSALQLLLDDGTVPLVLHVRREHKGLETVMCWKAAGVGRIGFP